MTRKLQQVACDEAANMRPPWLPDCKQNWCNQKTQRHTNRMKHLINRVAMARQVVGQESFQQDEKSLKTFMSRSGPIFVKV